MKVHKGIETDRLGRERPYACIETRRAMQPEALDLVTALGSKYFRNATPENDERPEDLPTSLTQGQIVKIYWDELLYWGTENLPRWDDGLLDEKYLALARKWLAELVLGAFPEMEGYLQ